MLIKSDENPSGLGYVMIDHRNVSKNELPPGITQQFVERDTYTCTHCNAVVVMNPERVRPRYKCYGCSHLICDNCAATYHENKICYTMEHRIDDMREQTYQQQLLGLIPKEN